jgi:hypothetical protein
LDSWQSIPIILNNRNRFDSLRRMVTVEPSLYAQGAAAVIRRIRSSRNVVSKMVVELSAVEPATPSLPLMPAS